MRTILETFFAQSQKTGEGMALKENSSTITSIEDLDDLIRAHGISTEKLKEIFQTNMHEDSNNVVTDDAKKDLSGTGATLIYG